MQAGVAGTQIVTAELKFELRLCRLNGSLAQGAADALSGSSPHLQWTVMRQPSILQRRTCKRAEGHLVVIHCLNTFLRSRPLITKTSVGHGRIGPRHKEGVGNVDRLRKAVKTLVYIRLIKSIAYILNLIFCRAKDFIPVRPFAKISRALVAPCAPQQHDL